MQSILLVLASLAYSVLSRRVRTSRQKGGIELHHWRLKSRKSLDAHNFPALAAGSLFHRQAGAKNVDIELRALERLFLACAPTSAFLFSITRCRPFLEERRHCSDRQQHPVQMAVHTHADEPDEPLVKLPRHRSNHRVNALLHRAEGVIQSIQSGDVTPHLRAPSSRGFLKTKGRIVGNEDKVYANNYVNMEDMEVIGFDYDYTLVTYTPALLYLIYDMARDFLVADLKYPNEAMNELPGYDPNFAIRGLAVDLETAWICHLTHTYRVSEAFFGRERVPKEQIRDSFLSKTGGGWIAPAERRKRLRPLNDLFSMVEACLLADVVQIFKDKGIPFESRSVVNDVLKAVGKVHISKSMHRAIVADMEKFIEPDARKHLRGMLTKFNEGGKKLMLVSNSEFWYVNAGMCFVVGDDWRDLFDVVIAPAGKPAFYTQNRPFREVSVRTGRVKFKPITELEPDEVYCDGSITELMKLTGWGYSAATESFDGSKILYLGDSIFADLVDARRLYGWNTGAIVREIRHEARVQNSLQWRRARHIVHALLHCVRLSQEEMGVDIEPGEPSMKRQEPRSAEDGMLLDALEALIAKWRDICECSISPTFGSIFRTPSSFGSTQSLFSQCMRRHADLYSSRVENFRLYSTDHRFYPHDVKYGNPHEAEPFEDSVLDLIAGEEDVEEVSDEMAMFRPPAAAQEEVHWLN